MIIEAGKTKGWHKAKVYDANGKLLSNVQKYNDETKEALVWIKGDLHSTILTGSKIVL